MIEAEDLREDGGARQGGRAFEDEMELRHGFAVDAKRPGRAQLRRQTIVLRTAKELKTSETESGAGEARWVIVNARTRIAAAQT